MNTNMIDPFGFHIVYAPHPGGKSLFRIDRLDDGTHWWFIYLVEEGAWGFDERHLIMNDNMEFIHH